MCNLVDIDTLARTIYGEARGESRQGKIAVACVILNRVKRKKMCDGEIEDITKGATHYYNPKACAQPNWAKGKAPCMVIGHHLFFNNID